jgi:hypothetical protein
VERWLPGIYLVVGLGITLLLCFVTAPFFAPDEPNQSLRAITLAHGEWMPTEGPADEAGALVDAGAVAAMDQMDQVRMRWERMARDANVGDFHDRPYGPVTEADERTIGAIRWSGNTVFAPFNNTAVYPPWLYLAAMAGWRAGEAAGWTIVRSLWLARVLSALTAVVLGWRALRVCRCSRWLLLGFLLLPSVLFLNASSSQDALLLPVCTLIAAMLSRPLAARREFSTGELAAMMVLLVAAGTARPPNAGMALVLFVPLLELPGGGWRRWLRPGLAFGVVLAVCSWWRMLVAPFGFDSSDEAAPELQEVFLRAHPLVTAAALLRGTGEAAMDFVRRGLYVVGWNDLLAPAWLRVLLGTGLLLLIVAAPGLRLRTWRGRALLGLAVVAPLLGIALAEYVIWTPPGFHSVYGVQPRYWLPIVPLALLLVKSFAWPEPRRLLLPATALVTAIACTLPVMAAHAFYRDGLIRVLRTAVATW